MRFTIVNNGTRYLESLRRFVEECGNTVTVVPATVAANLPDADAIILSGGHHLSVEGNDAFYAAELALIRDGGIPVLGVCLGFELIVHAFGGTLVPMPAQEKGMVEIRPLLPDPVFVTTDPFMVYENHRWVASVLPAELTGLASSKDGYEIVKHSSKPVYGVQFHPEMFADTMIGRRFFQALLAAVSVPLTAAVS